MCCNYGVLYQHASPGAQTNSKIFHRARKLSVKLTEHFPQRVAGLIRMQHNSRLGYLAVYGGVNVSKETLIFRHEEVSCIIIDGYNV